MKEEIMRQAQLRNVPVLAYRLLMSMPLSPSGRHPRGEPMYSVVNIDGTAVMIEHPRNAIVSAMALHFPDGEFIAEMGEYSDPQKLDTAIR